MRRGRDACSGALPLPDTSNEAVALPMRGFDEPRFAAGVVQRLANLANCNLQYSIINVDIRPDSL